MKKSSSNTHPPMALNFESKTASSTHSLKSGVIPRSLILNPSVQSTTTFHYIHPRIACVKHGLAWVQAGKLLLLLDRDGSVKDTVTIYFYINDIDATPDGDILLADVSADCVQLITREKDISILFGTDGKPMSLCCLHNKDIVLVVASENERKVVVYSREGMIKQTLNHSTLSFPLSIAVNKVNKDIYICDHDGMPSTHGKIMAFGDDGQFLYEYLGQDSPESPWYHPFTPVEVCTDTMGHIFITDNANDRVHLLDRKGQFISYILTSEQGMNHPNTIDVDGEGYIWVGQMVDFFIGCVKVAKYLE